MARILVVDDDEKLLNAVGRMLRNAGHEVTAFASGTDALALATRPDLAVLDIQMPDLSGPEVARRLHARWPNLPVVFMTGGARNRQKQEAQLLGPVLDKPFMPAELVAVVADRIDDAVLHDPSLGVDEFADITPPPGP